MTEREAMASIIELAAMTTVTGADDIRWLDELLAAVELHSQLAQATEQLKSSQDRIAQLEAQLKQTPNPAALDTARRQEASQDRIGQLEAQLKQAPNPADLDTGMSCTRSSPKPQRNRRRIGLASWRLS
jgi:BMFP domain-containing protein YqiC